MSYSVHNFRTGDTIEAPPINEMDAQILQNEEDILTKANINNPEFTGSISMGRKSGTSKANGSVAIGNNVTATGAYSHAEGSNTVASAQYSHAEGYMSTASGNDSHAEGHETTASGQFAHAEGSNTVASGLESHAEGQGTIANHLAQHVFGTYNVPDDSSSAAAFKGRYIEIVGGGNDDNHRGNLRALTIAGDEMLYGDLYVKCSASSTGGSKVLSSANKGVANGIASLDGTGKVPSSQLPSYVDDVEEYASRSAFPATGETGKIYIALDTNKTYRWGTTTYIEISDPASIIDDTAGSGDTDKVWSADKTVTLAPKANPVFTGSVSLGRKDQGNRMRGSNSTVLGNSSVASGSNSNALGDGLIAMGPCSHVIGEYNVPDAEEWVSGKLYHVNDIIVRYVRASGIITSILYFKCNTEHTSSSNQASDSAYWDNIDAYNLKYAEIVGNGYAEIDDQTFILTEHRSNARALDWDGNEYLAGDLFVRCNNDSTGGAKVATTDIIDDTAGNGDTDKVWSADKSYDELALKAQKADPVFTGSISLGRKTSTVVGSSSAAIGSSTTASGAMSFAKGYNTTSSGGYSSAEGTNTTASGTASHAEGGDSVASGASSHAENKSTASGNYSHADGYETTASGAESNSHGYQTTASGEASSSFGYKTVANHASQFVFGRKNVSDPSTASSVYAGNYIEIVGNGVMSGTGDPYSNARTLDWDGNERLKGDLYVGCNYDSTGGSKVLSASEKGVANGVASLDASTKIPVSQIPETIYRNSTQVSANSKSSVSYRGFHAAALVGTGSPTFTNNVRLVGWNATNSRYLKELSIEIGEHGDIDGTYQILPNAPAGTIEFYFAETKSVS